MQLSVADTDIVGRLYNQLRPVLGDLLAEMLPIQDFRGLFKGETVTAEMFKECTTVNAIFGSYASKVVTRGERKLEAYHTTQAAWDAVRQSDNREQKKTAVIARNQARSALRADEEQSKKDFAFLNGILHRWAKGKQDNRACLGTGDGFGRHPGHRPRRRSVQHLPPGVLRSSWRQTPEARRSGFACRGWKKDTSWLRTGRCSVSIHSATTMDPPASIVH